MKQRIFVILLLIYCCQFSFGATPQKKTLKQYISLCSEIADLGREIETYTAEVRAIEAQIDSLKLNWRMICEDYLNGDILQKEDLDYLIKNTDPEFDGQDLYDKLRAAQPTEQKGNRPRQSANNNHKQPKEEGKEEIGNREKEKGLNRMKGKDGNNM